MRAPNQLVHSRARARQRYALFPLAGYPTSRLPGWPDAEVRVLAAPALGANFVQYLVELPTGTRGRFEADDRVETFFYVLRGDGTFLAGDSIKMNAGTGHFGLTPPGQATHFIAAESTTLLVLRRVYERAKSIAIFAGHYGNESQVKAEVWADNPHSRLQTLIPDNLQYDMAVNIFTFDPGHGLPYVETHVMEHGLLFLEGEGMYYLDDEWMEAKKHDFIWMGPYCPQCFYATGSTPAKYIYFKNVNREIGL